VGGAHVSEDPAKKYYPGPAYYEDNHAYSKSTFNKAGPSYTIPLAGAMDIDASRLYLTGGMTGGQNDPDHPNYIPPKASLKTMEQL